MRTHLHDDVKRHDALEQRTSLIREKGDGREAHHNANFRVVFRTLARHDEKSRRALTVADVQEARLPGLI